MTQRRLPCVPAPRLFAGALVHRLSDICLGCESSPGGEKKGALWSPYAGFAALAQGWHVSWAAPPPSGRGAPAQEAALGASAWLPACWQCDEKASSLEPMVRPGKQGEDSHHHLPEGPWASPWVKPQQRMQLFLQRPGKGRARHPRILVSEQLLIERGRRGDGPLAGKRGIRLFC